MKFSQAVVLGTGSLPLSCALMIRDQNLPVQIYDMDEHPSGLLKRRSMTMDIPYGHESPKELFKSLSQIQEETLIVSAINPYILPKYLLENPHLTAINCHQALLPRHPGRNAEMWAIYEGDEKTGITWHILTSVVDGGEILIQKELPITEKHTSYQIFREQIRLAQEGFEEIIPSLLSGSLCPKPQESLENRALHYSYEVPNEGYLEPDWSEKKISAFLRAMDYSILCVVPAPKIHLEGKDFTWKNYKIHEEQRFPQGIFIADDSIYIQKQDKLFELCHYKKEDN